MNKITNIPSTISRGKRANIIQIDDVLYGVPGKKWCCPVCDREIKIPVEDMNQKCECGAQINWLPIIWRD